MLNVNEILNAPSVRCDIPGMEIQTDDTNTPSVIVSKPASRMAGHFRPLSIKAYIENVSFARVLVDNSFGINLLPMYTAKAFRYGAKVGPYELIGINKFGRPHEAKMHRDPTLLECRMMIEESHHPCNFGLIKPQGTSCYNEAICYRCYKGANRLSMRIIRRSHSNDDGSWSLKVQDPSKFGGQNMSSYQYARDESYTWPSGGPLQLAGYDNKWKLARQWNQTMRYQLSVVQPKRTTVSSRGKRVKGEVLEHGFHFAQRADSMAHSCEIDLDNFEVHSTSRVKSGAKKDEGCRLSLESCAKLECKLDSAIDRRNMKSMRGREKRRVARNQTKLLKPAVMCPSQIKPFERTNNSQHQTIEAVEISIPYNFSTK